mmetsp:Transcript_30252/g.50005  ORF Transcript_30252/g.50005 Transcript_30252/m.50005 type:complete len:292 (-) Transcript_30252:95-970(-)
MKSILASEHGLHGLPRLPRSVQRGGPEAIGQAPLSRFSNSGHRVVCSTFTRKVGARGHTSGVSGLCSCPFQHAPHIFVHRGHALALLDAICSRDAHPFGLGALSALSASLHLWHLLGPHRAHRNRSALGGGGGSRILRLCLHTTGEPPGARLASLLFPRDANQTQALQALWLRFSGGSSLSLIAGSLVGHRRSTRRGGFYLSRCRHLWRNLWSPGLGVCLSSLVGFLLIAIASLVGFFLIAIASLLGAFRSFRGWTSTGGLLPLLGLCNASGSRAPARLDVHLFGGNANQA